MQVYSYFSGCCMDVENWGRCDTMIKIELKAKNSRKNYQEKKDITNSNSAVSVKYGGKVGYLVIKRLLDIVLSLFAGIALLIPMLIVGIMVKLDSPGPVLFAQERLGKNGKPFTIYKFRTMRLNAEIDGPQWAVKEDDRCTRIGKILRTYRIDELPQLWNIFMGEMSIVGPRPERKYFYDKFEEYIPGFSERLRVTPGLTGYAQVNGGYDLLPEEKIIYDMYYIEHQSLAMDIKCIFQTICTVFFHEGAR